MSGKTELFTWVIIGISVLAAVTDLLRGKIYNWLTLPMMVCGMFASFYYGGWTALLHSMGGIGLGFVLYSWMYFLRTMGAGDVKFLMALGAWGGVGFTFDVGLLGVLLGGVLAILLIIFKGRMSSFSKRMYRFLLTLLVKELEPEFPKIDRKFTMPYGVPIAVAAIWVVLDNPLVRWGFKSWN
jgi:prepilin peptidase CpaA